MGGEEYTRPINIENSFIVCCDRAYEFLKNRGIIPDIILGDFDSLGFIPDGAIVFPKEKDSTDFELAVDLLTEKGYKQAEVYCGGGGREDHLITNYAVMNKAFTRGVKLLFFTDYTESFFASGNVSFNAETGQTVSVVSFGKSTILCSKGLKYRYDNTALGFNTSLGVSNEATESRVELEILGDPVLILKVVKDLA